MKVVCRAKAPLCWARGVAQVVVVSLGVEDELENREGVWNVEVKWSAAGDVRWRDDFFKMGAQTRCSVLSCACANVAFKCAGHAMHEKNLCAEGLLFTLSRRLPRD